YNGSKVGIVSMGAVGQLVCERLFQMNVDVFAYDPLAPNTIFEEYGVKRVGSLAELFRISNVVSLHTPLLPETMGMITGALLRLMPPSGVLINTARGGLLAEAEVLEVLKERPDLYAVLDVLVDEPNFDTSPFASLPNVFLTSHIAGSLGNECHRLGDYAVEEATRFLAKKTALDPVLRENIELMA
ncbi:MAG: NAD(P)-dependent oxidoreductase, partial [Puniceicoccales bacterium]